MKIVWWKIDKMEFIWRWGLPFFHWWAYPYNFRKYSAFKGKPIMWRLGLGWLEVRIFPKRDSNGNRL